MSSGVNAAGCSAYCSWVSVKIRLISAAGCSAYCSWVSVKIRAFHLIRKKKTPAIE
jgi:hypothetical protein